MALIFPVRKLKHFPEHFWLPLVCKDGLKLATYRHATARPRALVFFFHGLNSHAGEYADFSGKLAQEGFECFGMDHKGFGRSQGLHGYTGDFIDDMVMDGIAYIRNVKSIYEPNLPVFILGLSIGASVCMHISIAIPESITGMILLAPAVGNFISPIVQKIVRLISWISPFIGITRGKALVNGTRNPDYYIKREAKHTLAYRGVLRAGAIVSIIDCFEKTVDILLNITTPFVLIQGGADVVTDVGIVKKFYEESQVIDKELWFYDDMCHIITWEPEYPEILERTVKWIEARC